MRRSRTGWNGGWGLGMQFAPHTLIARRPDWALAEVPFLWLSVLALALFLREWSVLASWLIAPYLTWVSFASILNLTIMRLNRPFGTASRR